MKKITALFLALVLTWSLTGCVSLLDEKAVSAIGGADGPAVTFRGVPVDEDADGAPSDHPDAPAPPEDGGLSQDGDEAPIEEDGWYYSAEDVSLYLVTYGCLPDNFITKAEARALGWEGGSVEEYAPGYAIGGDVFGNREGLLPKAEGRTYYECDIDTNGSSSRGSRRICFSDDGLIYYTEDHYESFTLLYGEEGA
ncbi:MAG: ribonuclease domain-containing protein [Oscillospiraceae bacterium]